MKDDKRLSQPGPKVQLERTKPMSKQDRISWFEIPVTDLEKSAALYGKTLGIELKREVLFGVPHAILMAEGEAVTGTLISDPRRAPRKGVGTVVYLYTAEGVGP